MTTTLTATNLTISRDKTLCRALSIRIAPGDRWAILGPNGSGKTTLLHTLAGLLAPESGDVALNDQPLSTQTPKQIAQQVGLLFQDLQNTFPQTVYEYCLAGRFPHRPALSLRSHHQQDLSLVDQALAAMNLSQMAQKNIQHLSGGEKRRVAIAALLAQTPSIYLLDEPVNHLDLRHQIQALNIFCQQANRHCAVVMSLHDINLAQQYCNRVLMLFPDGSTIQGSCSQALTQENLSQLYQHPMQILQASGKIYWLPERTSPKMSAVT